MGEIALPDGTRRAPVPDPLPRPTVPIGPWIRRGRCVSADPEIFFPPRRPGTAAPAKAVCAACPVRRECLRHALKAPEEHGVWGGLDERERAEIRRKRREAARKRRAAA
jgi:WhiB family redox-sensing transcriptional regulator